MSELLNTPIAVLGAGSWGSALALLLAKKQQTVYLWDQNESLLDNIVQEKANNRYLPDVPFPSNIHICKTLAEALERAKDILIVVPSHGFLGLCQKMKPLLKEHRFIWATKGLELETGRFLHEVFEQEIGQKYPYAVLSGPSFAREVAVGLPTAVAVASRDRRWAEDVSLRFSNPSFEVELVEDIIGLQLGGVFKNVLAVAVGISDGSHLGANTRAALITKGLSQMMSLGKKLGAKAETLMGLSGCGDTILTCTDNQSRNRRFGLALAEGLNQEQALERIGQVVEAVYNIEQLHRLAVTHQVELPIVDQVFRIMKQGIPAKEAIGALFQ